MVELDIENQEIERTFVAWWSEHVRYLLAVPGFDTAQRFGQISPPHRCRFLQIYSVDSSDVLTSEAYRNIGGPKTSGLGGHFTNWYRNVFAGIDAAPVVGDDALLVVADDAAAIPADVTVTWMEAVALERSVPRRAIGVVPRTREAELRGIVGLRLLSPLCERFTKADHAITH